MNKKFKELYDFCQQIPCPPSINREVICGKAQDIMDQRVRVVTHGLDTNVLRGLFLSGHSNSRFVKQNGGNPVVVVARDMPREWRRFVQVKEMMHLFDEADELTSSAADLEHLLNSIMVPSPRADNPALAAEAKAVYMTLACFCPENTRAEFVKDFNLGHTEEYEISLKLRIPQHFVKVLLADDFKEIVESVWA